MGKAADFLSMLVATVFFIGTIPFAPGTLGTLAALAAVFLVRPAPAELLIAACASIVAGTVCAGRASRLIKSRDPGQIVVDEFAGYLVSVSFLPLTPGYLVSAFFLFRLFDILKPFPVGVIERRITGGLGIMLDDIAAGLITNLLLQIWRFF